MTTPKDSLYAIHVFTPPVIFSLINTFKLKSAILTPFYIPKFCNHTMIKSTISSQSIFSPKQIDRFAIFCLQRNMNLIEAPRLFNARLCGRDGGVPQMYLRSKVSYQGRCP